MKNCEHCKFLNTGYYGEGVCALFGDDCPDWANTGDGCKLKYQEVVKLIKLTEEIIDIQYAYPRDINGERPKEEKEKVDLIFEKYYDYLDKVVKKYA